MNPTEQESLASVFQPGKQLKRRCGRRPPLSVAQILAWADDHHKRTGRWPSNSSGLIPGSGGEKWKNLNMALRGGYRGLPGNSSLARLLAEFRGVRLRKNTTPLTLSQILAWADAHYQRTGTWPTSSSGALPDAPAETWSAINAALNVGCRGLPGGTSLPRFLAQHRGVPCRLQNRSRLSVPQVLAWADAHHQRTGQWPLGKESGPILDAPGENWRAVDAALFQGGRGLPKGWTLAQLLAEFRGVRNRKRLPRLSVDQILVWADSHHRRTGAWPKKLSGAVLDAPGETWCAINSALAIGLRGLPGGSSLCQTLCQHFGYKPVRRPLLRPEQILEWADLHHRRTGKWPTGKSGPVEGTPGETWVGIDKALKGGWRGLPGGYTLRQFLDLAGRRNTNAARVRLSQAPAESASSVSCQVPA